MRRSCPGYPKAANPGAYLNEHLLGDLRPTLFLAQLSNLLAGNISIVHGVTGSSRTFMGEEASGADAVRIACARIAAGQADITLVGGSYNAQRPDVLLHYEMGGLQRRAPFDGVWARQDSGGGMVLGSVGAFLVIESRAHAVSRGATPFGISPRSAPTVAAASRGRRRRMPGRSSRRWLRITIRRARRWFPAPPVSARSRRRSRHSWRRSGCRCGQSATAVGTALEPSFPASLALAAMAVQHGALFGPLEAAEQAMTAPLRQALVTSWGHWRGEALALVTAA